MGAMMVKIITVVFLLVFLGSISASAESLVRIQCEDEDKGTEVYLNGKFVGECPIDAPVQEGTVQLRAQRLIDTDHERLFEKSLVVVDGVFQRVEIVLSPPQLTALAEQNKQTSEAALQLRAAEAGDIDAMKEISIRYSNGSGLKKDPALAETWHTKAEIASAQAELQAAELGSVDAMRKIADRYDSGLGVAQDTVKAKAWRSKALVAKREQVAQGQEAARSAENRRKEQISDRSGPFNRTKQIINDTKSRGDVAGGVTMVPSSMLTDTIMLPTDLSDMLKVQHEAALRPSRWGKPDSMIAKASQQLQANGFQVNGIIIFADAN